MRRNLRHENTAGYALVVALILMSVSLLVVAGMLNISSTSSRTTYATTVRSTQYFDSESGIGHGLSWMRANSQSLVNPFRREEFYTLLERTVPTVGSNDTSLFTVPTKVKLAGTNSSAMLISDGALGSSQFPATRDITTGGLFAATSIFGAADVGPAQVRITLVDAIADDPTSDFGPPPAAEPDTDFMAVYRIDAMTATDEGSHVYAIVESDVINLFDMGIYGQDYLEIRQPCDSYVSADGPYTAASKQANCPAGSNSTSQVHKSEAIYGSLQTNGDIVEDPPFGGDVCADFDAGCPNPGETCAGEDCGVPLLENFEDWMVYCPVDQGNITIAGHTTLTVPGDLPMQKCWQNVTINNNVTLTLTSTGTPYYFHTLEFKNNSNSKLEIAPAAAGETIEVYVHTIVGDSFNGNQTINGTGEPTSFRLFYLGPNDLLLNGNADMNVALVAPNARVNVSGNFDYNGALLAKELSLTGSGSIHYDESLGGSGAVSDIQFKVRELVQYYR